jgi:hypothetical protein
MPLRRKEKKGVADITSALIGSGNHIDFNEEVDFLGANIDFDANASASGLSNSERILELTDGALNTVFTKKEFDKAKLLRNQTQEKVSLRCKLASFGCFILENFLCRKY